MRTEDLDLNDLFQADLEGGQLRFVGERQEPLGMVAHSPAMRQLIDLAQRVAKVDATVLISGESGTGKERVAKLVHNASSRAPGPSIAVNCRAIT